MHNGHLKRRITEADWEINPWILKHSIIYLNQNYNKYATMHVNVVVFSIKKKFKDKFNFQLSVAQYFICTM